jgi:hypothetical protein
MNVSRNLLTEEFLTFQEYELYVSKEINNRRKYVHIKNNIKRANETLAYMFGVFSALTMKSNSILRCDFK